MLRQWERQWKPSHWAVVFDGGTPQERLDLLATYKGNRPDMPEALRQQFPLVEEYLEGARIARLRVEGCEADDVIASVAARTLDAFEEILIVTSDKDFCQLVSEKIQMISPAKSEARVGIEDVVKRTGVRPERVVELLALTGDAADNVPGVPGMGPKTAARLLSQCDSLADLLSRPETVASEKTRESLAQHRDRILRNLAIIRLRCDLQVPLSVADMEARMPDPAVLLPFFEKMEFHGMADDLRTPSLL